jgi:hypothetical protein
MIITQDHQRKFQKWKITQNQRKFQKQKIGPDQQRQFQNTNIAHCIVSVVCYSTHYTNTQIYLPFMLSNPILVLLLEN